MSNWKKLLKEETERSAKNIVLSGEVKNASVNVKQKSEKNGQNIWDKLKNFVFTNKPIAAALAVAVCFIIAFPTVFAVKNASAQTTEIVLEINPSALFIADKNGKVKSVKATNSDADVILSDDDILNELTGKTISESVAIFIDNAAKLGYIDLDSDENAVKITTAKDDKETDEIVAAAKKYFLEKGVYSVVLKETATAEELSEMAGVSASGEKDFKAAVKNLPELYGERNITDIEKAYDEYIVSGLYNLVKNKVSSIVKGAELIVRMKIQNVEIKFLSGGKDYWSAESNILLCEPMKRMGELIEEYATVTGGKHVIKSSWDLNNVFLDYYELFGGINKETDPDDFLSDYLDRTIEYLDSLTTEVVKSNESKFVAVLDKTDLDTMGYESLTRVPESASEYRKDLSKVLSGLFVSREKEYKDTYNKERVPISEDEYEKYYDRIIENYGSLENFWKKIK